MKDIPAFTSEYGVASLILREIPYRGEAHIKIQASEDPELLLKECVEFCRACGAEKIDATGHSYLEKLPRLTAILEMSADRESLGTTETLLFPVQQETVSVWQKICNERMKSVPNAAYMTDVDAREMLEKGDGYFVHRDGKLLGIGRASGGRIDLVISTQKGSGADVVRALAGIMTEDTVRLTVADANIPALRLYERLGFVTCAVLSVWYKAL